MKWLKLVRWNNLLIILFTQFLIWFCVLNPFHNQSGDLFLLNFNYFVLLCSSTILIAAAGYIINDYFDLKIDFINRPNKVILENKVHRRTAIILHPIINFIGLSMAAYIAMKAQQLSWLWVQFFCIIALFIYSSHLKRMFMIGNVVVAILSSLTIVVMYVYEPILREYVNKPLLIEVHSKTLANPVWVLIIYTCFAFVLTLMREIVKDMEDHIGDAAEGCLTMPIKWGLLKTCRFVQFISTFAIIPLIIASIKIQSLLGIYSLIFLALPLIGWTIYLPKKSTVKHYFQMSRSLKIIMILGIGLLIIYYFQANE